METKQKQNKLKLYELLDTLQPFKEIKIIPQRNVISSILIATGFDWKKHRGWTYFATHIYHSDIITPQNESLHSETNTSGQAYTIVYKRWGCLIKRIKKDFENMDIKKVEE